MGFRDFLARKPRPLLSELGKAGLQQLLGPWGPDRGKGGATWLAALRAETVTVRELELQHGISAEELATWTTAYQAHGLDGLRVIKREPPIDLQIAERDEWRAAKLLIRRHGDQAQDEATRLANLVFFGDTWHSRWVRIGRAIEALQAPGRSERN